jgi:hypothetical protein
MDVRIIFLFFLVFQATACNAQFLKKKTKDKSDVPSQQQPTSLSPSSPTNREYTPKISRKATKGPTYTLEQQYYERVEAVAKERRKAEKMMLKPQYSDPMYFGHKRPPKKRKPSKMKYCKECGIRH